MYSCEWYTVQMIGRAGFRNSMLNLDVLPLYSQTCVKHKKWPLKAGGCLAEVNIRTKLKFGNILYDCLIKVAAKSGLTVQYKLILETGRILAFDHNRRNLFSSNMSFLMVKSHD